MSEPAGEAANPRTPELDGIRGIAIFLVMLVHFGPYIPLHPTWADPIILTIVSCGWVGVDLFFVLSGYLITGILVDSKEAPNYFSSFYMRRVLRILPLYYLSVLFFFVIFPVIAPRLRLAVPRIAATEQLWYWFHISNWRTAFYPTLYTNVSHFWSLAIEEQFYLVWPVIVFLCSPRRLRFVCVSIIVFSFGLRNLGIFQSMGAEYPDFLYRITPFRVDSLAVGACCALAMRDPPVRSFLKRRSMPIVGLGLAACVALIAVARTASPYGELMTRFGYSLLAIAFGAAILNAATHSGGPGILSRVLRSRLLMTWGKYSYGMYIFHSPINGFLGNHFLQKTGPLSAAVVVIVGISLTQAFAMCSWYAIELRFLKLKDRFRTQPRDHLALWRYNSHDGDSAATRNWSSM